MLISSFRSSNVWISYIHNFIFNFPGYMTNQFNDQLPVGLIAQLVRALYRYRRGQGSSPGKPDFFRLSFRNCISCVNNCEDLLCLFLHSAVQMYGFHIFIISISTGLKTGMISFRNELCGEKISSRCHVTDKEINMWVK